MHENEENIDAKTTENIEKKAVVTENNNAEKNTIIMKKAIIQT